jgi:hypothetical protein
MFKINLAPSRMEELTKKHENFLRKQRGSLLKRAYRRTRQKFLIRIVYPGWIVPFGWGVIFGSILACYLDHFLLVVGGSIIFFLGFYFTIREAFISGIAKIK